MAIRVLGILGSPCTTGTTAELLDAALEGARMEGAQVERFDLATMNIDGCRECGGCESGNSCAQGPDDMSVIYERIRSVDAIILASPIFFMGVTAQMKAMIDRCQCFWVERFVKGRRVYEGRSRPKGLFISCAGGSKQLVFEPAIHVVKAFFSAIDYEYAGEVLLGNTDDPGVGPRKVVALQKSLDSGRALCRK